MHIFSQFKSRSWKERFFAFWLSLAVFFPIVYIVALLADNREVLEIRMILFDHTLIGPAAVVAGFMISPVLAALLAALFATLEPFGNGIRNKK